ncbi:acyltransferase family protein [Pontibacillus yanchengensis]|uniref:Acyltransferase 3 domain-containing protein n=1 Tax=Pontibacillus yanchengensis Y32 TaxID=1385514 RepID=A0A0A2TEZ6_9BACI|nr:acyltransferase family protein [Pontibacillus yanchengensis]KGP74397.1 hypothetical protein N782_15305 [Pontibacillus yanchengensis Y32]
MNRKPITEIYFIRFIACISVVLIHSMTLTQSNYQLPELTVDSFYMIKLAMMYATPLFVMLSEFLLSYSYPDRLPKSFWKKRLLYIFVPYLVIAMLYSLYPWYLYGWELQKVLNTFFDKAALGLWHGYFVLIIFQFYALHYVMKKYFDRFSAKYVILISLIINALYLSFFNFMSGHDFPAIAGFWNYYKLPFVGWIFYFTVGYYAGKHIDTFVEMITKYKKWIYTGVIVTVAFPLTMEYTDSIRLVSSKRPDILLYTVFVFCALYLIAKRIKVMPKFVMIVSSYSYSIYLLHLLVMYNVTRYLKDIPIYINMGVYVVILFLAGIVGSILISYLISFLPFGQFMVGKVNRPKVKPAPVAESQNQPIHT